MPMCITIPNSTDHWTLSRRRCDLAPMLVVLLVCLLCTGITGARGLESHILQAQRTLQTLGYDIGSADGLLGPRTRQALQAFQHKNNLPATSTLDGATLAALGLLPPIEAPATAEPVPLPALPWHPVLVYLRYADSQPARLVPYTTERFRQNLAPQAWITHMLAQRAEAQPERLFWHIEHVETDETTDVPRAQVYVRSKLRLQGHITTQREIFSVIREGKTDWLIDSWQSETLPATQTAPKTDS